MNDTDARSPQTVYILGAGFSYGARVPLQAEILESLKDLRLQIDDREAAFFERMPIMLVNHFQEMWEKIQEFLTNIFSGVVNPSLEDVFTLLDQTIERRGYCHGMGWRDLEMVRTALYKAIVMLFQTRQQETEANGQLYLRVGAELIAKRLGCGQSKRGDSVISLNWDCVLENAIYRCLERLQTRAIDVDYCCYTIPFEGSDRHTTSIVQRAKNLYNVKVMKVHGSVNWLLCPNCNRLRVGLGASVADMCAYTLGKECASCREMKTEEETESGPVLEPFIISPTFMKQFDNAHIQMVWHNAHMDLCRADKVVFIGYSLPEADYHVRTLLKRAIRPTTEIEVVLVSDDRAPEEQGYEKVRSKYTESRYKAFFGEGEHIKYHFNGAEGYWGERCREATVDESLKSIRGNHADILQSFPL